MTDYAFRVKTGLRSGTFDQTAAMDGDVLGVRAPYRRSYGGESWAPSRENLLENWARETQSWLRSPRSRIREMVFPAQKVIRKDRYWELDSLRGLGIGMMMAQHFIVAGLGLVSKALAVAAYGYWILVKTWISLGIYAYLAGTAFLSPRFPRPSRRMAPGIGKAALAGLEFLTLISVISWLANAGSGAVGFMLVMGISMTISFARGKKNRPEQSQFPKALKRSTELFLCAGLLSILSYFIRPDAMVRFGILHMLAASTLLAFPFLSLPAGAAILGGMAVIALGTAVKTSHPALSFLFFNRAGLQTLDYFMLMPWFGAVLLGVALGKVLYPEGERELPVPDLSEKKPVEFLSWLGEHALPIFMLQEPFFFLGRAQTLG